MVGVEEGREFRFRGDLYSQESTFPLVFLSVISPSVLLPSLLFSSLIPPPLLLALCFLAVRPSVRVCIVLACVRAPRLAVD